MPIRLLAVGDLVVDHLVLLHRNLGLEVEVNETRKVGRPLAVGVSVVVNRFVVLIA